MLKSSTGLVDAFRRPWRLRKAGMLLGVSSCVFGFGLACGSSISSDSNDSEGQSDTGGSGDVAGTGSSDGSGASGGSVESGGSGASTGDGGSGNSGNSGSAGNMGGMDGDGGSDGSGASDAGPPDVAPSIGCEEAPDEDDFDHIFDVGPGEEYPTPSDLPWESLLPSTLVRIHARDEPYRDKWVVNVAGTEESPVMITGVPENSALPVIEGSGAITREELDYWNEARSLIKIGGSSAPDGEMPSYITLRCLELRGAHIGSTFTDHSGAAQEYVENAAAVHVEQGEHITIERCALTGSGNGLFSGSESSDLLVSGNYIGGNGNVDSIYHHNSYTESLGITFEFNHYGPLCEGCSGNNLKDRSAGTVIRYNWIEDGNRQLDLVDTDYEEFATDPRYRDTYVYGNVLVESEGAGNRQIIHYGGDSGDEERYRKGTLHLFSNTIVSTREGRSTLVRLSSEDESIEADGNLIYVSSGGSNLELLAEQRGQGSFTSNWLSEGWVTAFESTGSGNLEERANIVGSDPGFEDESGQDYSLASDSTCVASNSSSAESAMHPLSLQYLPHQGSEARQNIDDIGAFQYRP